MQGKKPLFPIKGKRVFVAGHRGMVGSAIERTLATADCEVLTVGREACDLRDGAAVRNWMKDMRPDVVILAAAKVGGILANSSLPVDFISDNLAIQQSVVTGAHMADVDRLVFLGSSCIYPKFAPQPIPESALLTGPLEPTNQWYAVAKIAGIKLCEAYRKQYGRHYISVMPTNLYGINDNFELESSHVLPALMRKVHDSKTQGMPQVVVWGTGAPRREFLNVDDLADAVRFITEFYDDDEHINAGSGTDISIKELAELLASVIGYRGKYQFDLSKPDGTPRKLMDSSKLFGMGWRPSIPFEQGIKATYDWYVAHRAGQSPSVEG